MNPVLYFLRSSEQRVATTILHFALGLDAADATLEQFPQFRIYDRLIGKFEGDIGLYAMVGSEVAGAAWVRLLKPSDGGVGYIDAKTPELVIGVKPLFRRNGVATALLEQLFAEVSHFFPQMSVCVRSGSPAMALFEKSGFVKVEGSERADALKGSETFTMVKVFVDVSRKAAPDKAQNDALNRSARGYYDLN